MSGLIVGLVLRLPITDRFTSEAKLIAAIYADHAWEDGTHAYPSVPTVARMSGLSERTVQRYLRTLEDLKLLIVDGKGQRGTNKYKFPIEENKDRWVRLSLSWGDSVSPIKKGGGDTDSGDIPSGDTDLGDTIVSPKQLNKPSLTTTTAGDQSAEIFRMYEAEIGLLTPLIRDALNGWLADVPHQWLIDAMRRAVVANKRSWSYVEAILRAWKANGAQDTRPIKKESNYGNSKLSSGGKSGAQQPRSAPADYSDADRAAAERVKRRRASQAGVS